jgi:hypothetical protein
MCRCQVPPKDRQVSWEIERVCPRTGSDYQSELQQVEPGHELPPEITTGDDFIGQASAATGYGEMRLG